jgi:hypothetical protein
LNDAIDHTLQEVKMDLRKFDDFENNVIDLVAKIAPWFAPIPTAFLVGRATVVHLEWPPAIGFLAAVVIESLGLVFGATAFGMFQFKQNRLVAGCAGPLPCAQPGWRHRNCLAQELPGSYSEDRK